MKWIRIGVLVFTAAFVVGSTAPSASAAPPDDGIQAVSKTYVDGEGVFHYAFDPSLRSGAATRTITGVKGADGTCFLSGEITDSAGTAGGTAIDELTYNPATCQSTVAITESSETLQLEGSLQSAGGATASAGDNPPSAQPAAAASYSYWASVYAYIADPVFLVTTSTTGIRSWSANGTWYNQHSWYWFSDSGWGRTSSGVTNNSTTCDTRATYSNLTFWDPTLWTYASHSKTKLVTSTSSGSFTWSYAMDKWGEKADWLSYHVSMTHN